MIPYGRQDINRDDIDAVVKVLCSDFLTQGPVVPEFENVVASYCGTSHAVAVNSATSALHIACLALGVGQGDIVWTTPISFVASANCALYCGATVDFVDIDSRTYNMSTTCLAEKLEQAEKSGILPKVVIPVHLCGQSCDMATIYNLSQQYGFKIIEDASHAIGGRYQDKPVGSCLYSDITVFSFHPVKIITTAEGGMALTNDALLAKQMQRLRCHGITSDPVEMSDRACSEIWNYQQVGLGFNYRMTDIHAALGVSQMKRLDEFVSKRQVISNRYDQMLSDLPLILPYQSENCYSSLHLYPICLDFNGIQKTQRKVYDALRSKEIYVNLHYIPIYRQPFYEKMGFRAGYCPQAEQYYSTAISIPIYPNLTSSQQDIIIALLREQTVL